MDSQSHVTTLSSMITQCDPNPAYGVTVPPHTQTSETGVGDLVVQLGSNSATVNCQAQRGPPAGEVHTVDVNELQHVYDYAYHPEPAEPPDQHLTVSCMQHGYMLKPTNSVCRHC